MLWFELSVWRQVLWIGISVVNSDVQVYLGPVGFYRGTSLIRNCLSTGVPPWGVVRDWRHWRVDHRRVPGPHFLAQRYRSKGS